MTKRIDETFADDAVEVIYVQTTFEGHGTNDFERARSERKKWSIARPVGHDAPDDPNGRPHTMRDYRTGGTPWTAVIDKHGRLRFNDFTRDFAFHRSLVQHLLAES